MKEKIIMIILLVSIVLVLGLAFFGLSLGKLKILSVSELTNKNQEVNDQIDEVKTIVEKEYPAATQELERASDSLKIEKQKYEEIAEQEGEDSVYTTEKFDIEYLWTTIGKYASRYNIGLIMDVKKTSGSGLYDLNFTITGEYVNISRFIGKLENDSELSFRIYDFKLTPGTNGQNDDIKLKATFTVKDVNINDENLIKTGNTTNSIANITSIKK